LLLIPLLYLLSLGPVIGLFARELLNDDVYRAYTWPAAKLDEALPRDSLVESALGSYLKLWLPSDKAG